MNIFLKFLLKHSLLCSFHFKSPPFFLREEMWRDDTDSISGTLSWATWLQQQCAWCTTLAYRRSPMSSTQIRCLSTGIGGWGGLSSIMQKTARNRWLHGTSLLSNLKQFKCICQDSQFCGMPYDICPQSVKMWPFSDQSTHLLVLMDGFNFSDLIPTRIVYYGYGGGGAIWKVARD